jgi:hypothetical protein
MTNALYFNIKGLSKQLILNIKKDFRLINPLYQSNQRMNIADNEEPKYLNGFEIKDDVMIIPRGWSSYLAYWLSEYDVEYRIVDNRLKLPNVEFPELKFELYDHQKKWVKKGYLLTQGTVESPCFVKGTKIKTVDGYKNIEDIKSDDLIFAYDAIKDEIVLEKVVRHCKNKLNERLVKVTIESYSDIIEILCTENHKFYSEGKWIKAKDLKGRKVLINNEPSYRNRSWLYQKYIVENLSAKEIADKFNVKEKTVRSYTERFGLFKLKDIEKSKIKRIKCKCGCGRYTNGQGEYCKGHHQKIRMANMSEKEKKVLLKNWINAGYSSMIKGRKIWWKSLSDDEKLIVLNNFIKAGNRASLKSAKKGSRPQRKIYNYLKKHFPNQKWVYDYVFNTTGKGCWQIDIFNKELKICIEHDGPVHREDIFGRNRLNIQLNRDKIKNKIVLYNGYYMIRIIDNRLNDYDLLNKAKILKSLINSIIDKKVDKKVVHFI